MSSAPVGESPPSPTLPPAAARELLRWHGRVTRWAVATMVAALVVCVVNLAVVLPDAAGLASFAALCTVAARWLWLARAGRCPACGAPVRLEPRVGLPPHCPACGARFVEPAALRSGEPR